MRAKLESFLASGSKPYRFVVRVRMILYAADGMSVPEIARTVGLSERWVRKWKARFIADPHWHSLEDQQRSGRPRRIPLSVRCRLVMLACMSRGSWSSDGAGNLWSYSALAQATTRETGCDISVSEVGRTLRFEGIRPHNIRYWLNSKDPEFETKAERVCETYLNPPVNTVVLSVDEKPLQVIERKNETTIDDCDGSNRFEYEYIRHGTQQLLAALDVHTGKVHHVIVDRRDSEATLAFVQGLVDAHPGKKIIIVWDNLSTHKGERWIDFNERNSGRISFVYTPLHASWMNQIEIWFSILQRAILRRASFPNKNKQSKDLRRFIARWNETARPFNWTWRASEHKRKSARIEAYSFAA